MELEKAIKILKQCWKETKFNETEKRIAIETVLQALENSIFKEVIEKKIEEIQPRYKKYIAKIDKEELKNISISLFKGIKLEAQREILQELLKEEI